MVSVGAPCAVAAEVPLLLHHQGRITVGSTALDGTGMFRFALVSQGATQIYWSNSPDADADGEPDAAVALPLTRGLYAVQLGDTSLPNMAALPSTIASHGDLHVRVWFDDGVNGSQRLAPDQRLVAVPYSMIAASVADGAITQAKLAPGALAGLEAQVAAQAAELAALSNLVRSLATGPSGDLSKIAFVSPLAADPSLIQAGLRPFTTIPAPSWVAGPARDEPAPRFGHSGVWDGLGLMIWGGAASEDVYLGSGSRYSPASDEWRALASTDAPAARTGHSAVWTGSHMIIWGGFDSAGWVNTGGRLRLSGSEWNALSTMDAPAGRDGHVAIWTGTRMVVWGGRNESGLLNDGAVYQPANDRWTPLNLPNAPARRRGAAGIWTADRLLVWGGEGPAGPLGDGAQLRFDAAGNPVEWRPLSLAGAPRPRHGHTAVWTGTAMLIWGGESDGSLLGDGAAYEPDGDAWTELPVTGAPVARAGHNASWTGDEMLIVGGENSSGALLSGGAYAPANSTWRSLNSGGSAVARSGAAAVWTGTELLVFGGRAGQQVLGALRRLNPQPALHLYRK